MDSSPPPALTLGSWAPLTPPSSWLDCAASVMAQGLFLLWPRRVWLPSALSDGSQVVEVACGGGVAEAVGGLADGLGWFLHGLGLPSTRPTVA